MDKKYSPVIGLEIHVELSTQSKMFCQCSADWFGKEPNTQTCPVCLGLPGALPVPNEKAIEWCLLMGKALECQIATVSKFDRKHYFYPDLPKGYQISQYDQPFCFEGTYTFTSRKTNQPKTITITRVHMEEDTGKLIHEDTDTSVDFNRSGVPLVEIVTGPDFDDSDDVNQFLEELQVLVRYLGASDADMEKGSMRLEPNISVRESSSNKLPDYKVEIKNINSFRFAKMAIDIEVKRHMEMLEKGETPIQETRGFNEKKNDTISQRVKEEAQDYRYFPEPDIPPFTFTKEFIKQIADQLPELPTAKYNRYVIDLGLNAEQAWYIVSDLRLSKVYELTIKGKDKVFAQQTANVLKNKQRETTPGGTIEIAAENLAKQVDSLYKKKTTDPGNLVAIMDLVVGENAAAVKEYKDGKTTVLMFLVGQVMKGMKGQADANVVRQALEKKLNTL